jgi:hypothetical protein
MPPRFEAILTIGAVVVMILVVGVAKGQGWVDDGYADIALGTVTGGGVGWLGKGATVAPKP